MKKILGAFWLEVSSKAIALNISLLVAEAPWKKTQTWFSLTSKERRTPPISSVYRQKRSRNINFQEKKDHQTHPLPNISHTKHPGLIFNPLALGRVPRVPRHRQSSSVGHGSLWHSATSNHLTSVSWTGHRARLPKVVSTAVRGAVTIALSPWHRAGRHIWDRPRWSERSPSSSKAAGPRRCPRQMRLTNAFGWCWNSHSTNQEISRSHGTSYLTWKSGHLVTK